jgi:hypothetical protein
MFRFSKEEIEQYKDRQILYQSRRGYERVKNAIEFIKKLKKGGSRMYQVLRLIEAKLLLKHCIDKKIRSKLVIIDLFDREYTYLQYKIEMDENKIHPRTFRSYIRVYK